MSETSKLRKNLLKERDLRKRIAKFRAGNIAMTNAVKAAGRLNNFTGSAPESVLKHGRAARRIRNLK